MARAGPPAPELQLFNKNSKHLTISGYEVRFINFGLFYFVLILPFQVTFTSKTNAFESVKANVKVIFWSLLLHAFLIYSKVSTGKWYYEVKIQTGGLLQIGWCTEGFKPDGDVCSITLLRLF